MYFEDYVYSDEYFLWTMAMLITSSIAVRVALYDSCQCRSPEGRCGCVDPAVSDTVILVDEIWKGWPTIFHSHDGRALLLSSAHYIRQERNKVRVELLSDMMIMMMMMLQV